VLLIPSRFDASLLHSSHSIWGAYAKVQRFEGYLKEVTVDDKGFVAVIGFGVPPHAHDDDPVRGLQCAMVGSSCVDGKLQVMFVCVLLLHHVVSPDLMVTGVTWTTRDETLVNPHNHTRDTVTKFLRQLAAVSLNLVCNDSNDVL
jgi:hypothetical protein